MFQYHDAKPFHVSMIIINYVKKVFSKYRKIKDVFRHNQAFLNRPFKHGNPNVSTNSFNETFILPNQFAFVKSLAPSLSATSVHFFIHQ